jgi:hypothetical protein
MLNGRIVASSTMVPRQGVLGWSEGQTSPPMTDGPG